jgi:hypothetical protein
MPDLQNSPDITSQERYARTAGLGAERVTTVSERMTPAATEEERSMEVAAGGASLEALAGVGAAVLAIIGLSTHGNASFYCLTVATIVTGAALIAFGAGLAARMSELLEREAAGLPDGTAGVGAGMTLEVLGGIAGIVLGILGVIGIATYPLVPIAVIVFGAVLLLSSRTVAEMNDIRIGGSRASLMARRLTRLADVSAAGVQALVGIATGVLGILAVCNVSPATLSLVGLLCAGCAMAVSGGAVSSRLFTFLGHSR